jgi:hypothetical protein
MTTTWEMIAEKVKGLGPERQREVLDFLDSLVTNEAAGT